MQVWDHTTTALVATGVRVLRYDLYGRGFSSRLPAGTQHDLDLYVAQLEELLATLQEHRSLVLVGSSMGAIVASEFALRHPAQVAALALVGPAGFPIEVPFLARLRELPIVGDWLSRWLGREAIVEQNRRYFHREEARARFLPYFVDQLEVDGSVEAILSTMRHVPVDDYLTSYRALDALGFPVLVLWGRHDATFPFHSAALLAGAAPGFHIVPVEEAAHLPQYERPEVVNPLLAAFVQDHLAP
jgi:pimeloyl-ACP methyl ester carboxylesterase